MTVWCLGLVIRMRGRRRFELEDADDIDDDDVPSLLGRFERECLRIGYAIVMPGLSIINSSALVLGSGNGIK